MGHLALDQPPLHGLAAVLVERNVFRDGNNPWTSALDFGKLQAIELLQIDESSVLQAEIFQSMEQDLKVMAGHVTKPHQLKGEFIVFEHGLNDLPINPNLISFFVEAEPAILLLRSVKQHLEEPQKDCCKKELKSGHGHGRC